MIEIRMRSPHATMLHPLMRDMDGVAVFPFTARDWVAAKNTIRDLESNGWTFVAMKHPDGAITVPDDVGKRAIETWDDCHPHTAPTKPPFNPRTAGWESCGYCFDGIVGFDNLDCPHCDGLGIVVGPPGDGKSVERFLDERAMYLPSNRLLFTRAYWSDRD